ncbi:MAG: type II toxin-antitoxin system VapC family toxin [Acidobacteriota bacterium]
MIFRILDTSVAGAWYFTEETTAAARRWQHMMLDGKAELRVPSFHYWEFGNLLRTRVKRGEVEPGLAAEVYAVHLQAPLVVTDPDRGSVLDVALRYDATVYDAVYIALCLGFNVPLLTSERSTAAWVRKLGKLADCVR